MAVGWAGCTVQGSADPKRRAAERDQHAQRGDGRACDECGRCDTCFALMIFKVSKLGKLFAIGGAAWLVGRTISLKREGERRDVEALKKALMSSERFMRELREPGATVDSVMEKLKLKGASPAEFQRITGVPWPL